MFGRLALLGAFVVILSTALTFVVEPERSTADTTPTPTSDLRTPTPEPTPEPTAVPAPAAFPEPPAAPNRQDCSSIRGTTYLSAEERSWFLANCVPR